MGNINIDLKRISIEEYGQILRDGPLLPGRMALKEDVDLKIMKLKKVGVENLEDLVERTKNKRRVEELSASTGISEGYLVILRREVNSLRPRRSNLSDIPGIDIILVDELGRMGITRTDQLLERSVTEKERLMLARTIAVTPTAILELVKLSDLLRINGVGPAFARIIYLTGKDTVEKVALVDPEELYERIIAVNKAELLTKANVGVKDVEYCIRFARMLPKAITY